MKGQHRGLKKFYHAAIFSWRGFVATWKNEEAFRVEIVLAALMLFTAPLICDSHLEFIALLAVFALVIAAELINSAIESVIDRIGEEFHELSGRAKDQGSAAVATILIFGGITWLLIAIY